MIEDERNKAYENKRNDLSGYRNNQRTAYQTSGSPGNSETGKGDSTQRDGKKPPKFLKKKNCWKEFPNTLFGRKSIE